MTKLQKCLLVIAVLLTLCCAVLLWIYLMPSQKKYEGILVHAQPQSKCVCCR